ncbi:MAG: polyphosphate kinase 2 family protein [Thermoplasmata archaeon]
MSAGFDRLRIAPGRRLRLSGSDASATPRWTRGKRKGEAALPALRQELDRLQELLYADGRRGLLVVLQGMDTSGKDGVIRQVFEGVNPQGVQVSSFKRPTPEELRHDFLWRIHRRTPSRGEIMVFNRSHYEDVLVARVHRLVPRRTWSKRFDAINGFERELVDEGFSVLKFFLHISRDEQRRRLQDRLEDPTKQWKLNAADLEERRFWPEYQAAYEEVLRRTSTRWAPWYLVPSDHKWYRNLAIATLLVEALEGMHLRYPKPTLDVASLKLE